MTATRVPIAIASAWSCVTATMVGSKLTVQARQLCPRLEPLVGVEVRKGVVEQERRA